MIHHYLHKGHELNYLVNLPYTEKMLLKASMELFIEEENAKWNPTN